jgi:hypothetical protein
MTDPTDKDWCSAACADALVEGLTIGALQAAHDVARTPEEFFWAVQSSIRLNEIVKGDRT